MASGCIRGLDLDVAGDDLFLEVVDLGLQLLGHVGSIGGRQLDSPVLQGADVVIGGEVALGGLLDGVEHGFVDSLDHGGQHDVAVFGALGPVVVDTNDPYITGIGGGSRGTEADGSGNRHDDVGVLGDELLRQCL